MNRRDLQRLAESRLEDARILLANRRYGAAYYLCGYAVECALKACIAQQIKRHEYPPSANFSRDLFTHELSKLIALADLQGSLRNRSAVRPGFQSNWETVSRWTVESRYQHWARREAIGLYRAVTDVPDGVLEWIRAYW
jgi:hypothetical protein